MSKQILAFMLRSIEDQDIHPIVQQAYDLASAHLDLLESIFKAEQYAIPIGFTEEDVDVDAPWLFTDVFGLTYVNHMARIAMVTYSGFLAVSYRADICDHYLKSLNETGNLYTQSLEIALNKGVNARHPYIEVPKEVDY